MFNNTVVTGGTIYHTTQNINSATPHNDLGALKLLTDAASPSAFHNSGLRHDPPKCHEDTRVAVLEKLKGWAIGADPETRNKCIMWMYGGAGAGKSAIGQTFAEKCDDEGRLLASFFFGRSDATRNQAKFLVPTITCQIYERIPGARNRILSTIDNDPMILNKTLLIQLESLVIEPLIQLQDTVNFSVIVIDGLDECLERTSQTTILRALFDVAQRPNCRIRFLLASRPEHDIVTAFSLHADAVFARLMLDDKYGTYDDIKLFLADKIRGIKEMHPFRHLIPPKWPEDKAVSDIVKKSSGQFIYVSTAVKFIESIRHLPHERMDIVRNLRPAQGAMPFTELDALYVHVTVTSLEEIHGLEPGSLKLIICDLGALVSIVEQDRIKVLHALLLDFVLESSRSKDLPISGDALMKKHITTCFRFLSKNKISTGTDISIFSTQLAVRFLKHYLAHNIPIFTADIIAEALDGFSLLKLCQQNKLHRTKHRFLKWVNPVIVKLLQQSDQQQLLSRYLTMMDESLLALMDKYPCHALALQISILMTPGDVFPRSALDLAFQLPEFSNADDKLAILCFSEDSIDLGPTKANRDIICEFLLNPTRSQHHSFQKAGPRVYVMALLGCFGYLGKIIIWEDCSIDETFFNQHADLVALSKAIIPENQVGNATSENNYDKSIAGSSKEYSTIDTEMDMKAWQQGWQNDVLDSYIGTIASLYDLASLKRRSKHLDGYRTIMRARYYLMLGYLIYFFPHAGFSQELIKLCKTTLLHRDPRLFPEQTAAAQRAMGAYLQKMAYSLNNIKTNTFRGSNLNLSDISTTSTAVDYQEVCVITTATGFVIQD